MRCEDPTADHATPAIELARQVMALIEKNEACDGIVISMAGLVLASCAGASMDPQRTRIMCSLALASIAKRMEDAIKIVDEACAAPAPGVN